MTARDIIARAFTGLYSWGDCRADTFAEAAVEALTAAGYRLIPPGGMDAETDDAAYQYAKRLLLALMEKHYPDRSPNWKPLPDLVGVLTQIDNLTTGLTRIKPAPAVNLYAGEI